MWTWTLLKNIKLSNSEIKWAHELSKAFCMSARPEIDLEAKSDDLQT